MKKPTLKSVFDSSVVCCDVEALAHGYALSGSNPSHCMRTKQKGNHL